jgi:phospholipid/cholesterol/gamma-HCH transport system substrate-binding protein
VQKQTPNLPRIGAMVIFALSCFCILIWLWLSFGGPVHLQPQKFRFKAQFDESPMLTAAADVRISGLSVGKIKKLSTRRDGGQLVEMEIDEKYAPIPEDSRMTLRNKTILGQAYLELSPGQGKPLPEGDTIERTQIEESVQVDEILGVFDDETREHWRGWIREVAKGLENNGETLNDAIGNLPDFADAGSEVLRILHEQDPVVRRLVRNAGITNAALNERRDQLRQLIINSNNFFGATASRDDALAETVFIMPTFLEESRLTNERLREFAIDTQPLIRTLTPVTRMLRPTVRDLGRLAPDLEAFFRKTDPLIRESDRTLSDGARFTRGASPLFSALHVYLPEFNPFISFLNWEQEQVGDFLYGGSGSLNGFLPALPGEGNRHYLRQFSITNSRSLAIQTSRQNWDRGLAYPAPNYMKRARVFGMTESWDCKPTNGEQRDPQPELPPCFVQPQSLFDGNFFPRLRRGEAPNRVKPEGNDGRRPAQLP